jgi:outer membrane protein TolC
MNKSFLFSVIVAGAAATASAQTSAPAAPTVHLTVDQAVQMALEHNVDLSVDRLDPQISDTRVAAAAGAFRPYLNSTLQQNNQQLPPSNLLFPFSTFTNVFTSSAGLSQRLPRFGTTYSVGWNATHTDSNSVLNNYNPLVQSGLSLSVSQPFLRDFTVDANRQQLATTRINRDIAGTRLRESIVHTTTAVKTAYWNLVAARANVDARRSVLALAQELVRVNKAKVDVGTAPPLDLVSAQAEVAADQEQLIIAETAVKQTEDRLRTLIYDPTDAAIWAIAIDPVDAPPLATITPDVNAAIASALHDRADVARARKDIENAQSGITFTSNQRLPDVRLNASFLASGLGGTQILRAGGFPGTVVGPGDVTAFGSVLNQLFLSKYPTWTAGVNVTYPLGRSADDANYARARIEEAQTEQRLKSVQAKAVQELRDAAWQIEMNGKRIETTRAARDLAEQRLDAERKRFDVGMSTNFLVIQAQRDLAQARTNELSAILAYDLSLVNFESLQLAGPAQQTGSQQGSGGQGGQPSSTPTGTAPVPAAGTPTASTTGVAIPGFTR